MQLLQTAEFENYDKKIQSHRSPNKQNVVHLKKKKDVLLRGAMGNFYFF